MEVCLVARARVRDARSDGLVTTMLSDLIQATACGSEEGGEKQRACKRPDAGARTCLIRASRDQSRLPERPRSGTTSAPAHGLEEGASGLGARGSGHGARGWGCSGFEVQGLGFGMGVRGSGTGL